MSDILSQDEIEALLSSLSSGDSGAPAAQQSGPSATQLAPPSAGASPLASRPNSRATISYEVYDFRRPDKFSKEQLRTLQMLHEAFARLAGSSLSANLRTQVHIELISLEQTPYEEYLRSINQSVFTIMSLPPLSGQAVLEIEFSLVFTIIDRLLGGPGRSLDRAVLTDIEQPLVRQVIERMFVALKSAWEGVVIVNPGTEAIETSAQFVQIAPPTDIVVSILFEVRVGESRGAMSLCIPYMVLKPITTKLSAQKWFANSARRQSGGAKRVLSHQVRCSTVSCSVKLGQSKLSIRDFLRLRSGDIVRLDRRADETIELLVQDTPKFAGRPALKGHKLVFTVSDPLA